MRVMIKFALPFESSNTDIGTHKLAKVWLDPCSPWMAVRLNQTAIGLYFVHEYEAAVEAAKRVIRAYPENFSVYRWLTAALAQAGRAGEAKEALDKAIALAPNSFEMYVRQRVPWHRPEDHAHMVEGLRKAGWAG